MKKISGVIFTICVWLLSACAADAASYPSYPVRLVVPLAAGSTADILARAIQPGLSKALGTSVVVEDRPGGGGQIAMSYVAKAKPDGYTLVMGSNNTWAINIALFSQLSYDPVKDFAPVAYLAGGTNVLIVPPTSPYHSVKALVAAMQAHPGKLTFSSGGNGTTHHLSSVLLNEMTHTSAVHVPYTGAPQGVTAVMTSEVNFGFYNTPSVVGLIKEGKLRALATTGTRRSPLLPTTPTMEQAGVAGYTLSVDFGLLAPAGTPVAIVDKINAATRKVMDDPAFQKRMKTLGYEVFADETPAQFQTFIANDIKKWVPLVKASGAHVN